MTADPQDTDRDAKAREACSLIGLPLELAGRLRGEDGRSLNADAKRLAAALGVPVTMNERLRAGARRGLIVTRAEPRAPAEPPVGDLGIGRGGAPLSRVGSDNARINDEIRRAYYGESGLCMRRRFLPVDSLFGGR